MNMRTQVLLSAISTAVLCGLVGLWILGTVAGSIQDTYLDGDLRFAEQGVRRLIEVRRNNRAAAYQVVAHQSLMRTSLTGGDRVQLGELAKECRQVGADAVAIVDVASTVLAADGPQAAQLVATTGSQGLSETPSFIVVAGNMMEGVRIPIGADPPVGYLIAANRIDRESLRLDAEPLGVLAALSAGEVLVTTLPPGVLTTARWRELLTVTANTQGNQSKLGGEYQIRAAPLGNGHLLVAIPQSRAQAFRDGLVRLSAGLALFVVAATIGMVIWLLGRILQPLGKLTRAAELLGRGQLARSRNLLESFSERPDELGGMARAQLAATTHLQAVAKSAQRLARQIESTIDGVEEAASSVAASASGQEERLVEVSTTLEPLAKALLATSQGMQDAQGILTALSLSSSATDQAQAVVATAVRRAEALLSTKEKEPADNRGVRTASVLQQASAIAQAVADQREVFLKVRESVASLRTCIDTTLESQIREQHHGQHAHRATVELARLAKLHASEAEGLRTATEELGQHLGELLQQLGTLDSRNSDDAARLSGDERQPVGERARNAERSGLHEPTRRGERPRGGQGAAGAARRSTSASAGANMGASSSQSLAPVTASSTDRRAASATGTPSVSSLGEGSGRTSGNPGASQSAGVKPVGRSSGNYPKVPALHDSSPSGASLRSLSASASGASSGLAGGNAQPKAIGAAPAPAPVAIASAALSSSSGTVRPVIKLAGTAAAAAATKEVIREAPGSGRLAGNQAAGDPGASSKSLRPVAGAGPLPGPGPLADPADSASAQSLNNPAPTRRK